MEAFDNFWAKAVEIAWGLPLVVLLISAGMYFTATSRFIPFRALKHAIQILRGRFDNPDDPGVGVFGLPRDVDDVTDAYRYRLGIDNADRFDVAVNLKV